jgi:hypothetical protein
LVILAAALLVAWATVRFVVPLVLGWPVITCIPENLPPTHCPDSYSPPSDTLAFLLPVTEVTIEWTGNCREDRYRYLGGIEGGVLYLC